MVVMVGGEGVWSNMVGVARTYGRRLEVWLVSWHRLHCIYIQRGIYSNTNFPLLGAQ